MSVGEGEPLDERDNVTLEVTDGVAVRLERGEKEAETVGEIVGDVDGEPDCVTDPDAVDEVVGEVVVVGAFVAAAAGSGWT